MGHRFTGWGYLSKDAEQRQVANGSVTSWNVPIKQGWGEREQTNWFRVNIWGKRADYAAKARKGDFVVFDGELSIGEYNGKPQYEVRADDFQSVRTAPRETLEGVVTRHFPAAEELNDDIPF